MAVEALADEGVDDPLRLSECFVSREWLAANGLPNRHNLLDYFACSPFFAPGALLDRGGGSDALSAPGAIVYALRSPQPAEEALGLFVVERRQNGVMCAAYACLGDGLLVQAPPLRELILARAGRAAAHLSAALQTLQQLEEAERAGGAQ